MPWTVKIRKGISKSILKLPPRVQHALAVLVADIKEKGPVRMNWPNYGKLACHLHHCHIRKGRPTYVAVWEETDKHVKLIEVRYVGTHEKAPY
jgi:hypothetical protein